MLRVVIDTSSLVSYLLTQGDLMRRVVARWRAGDFVLLSSPATRSELAAVIARPEIRRLSSAPLDKFMWGFERFTENVPETPNLSGACRDAKDEKFLACAIAGKAQYLVSSDRDLLDLHSYQDIPILNPGQFLLAYELYAMEPQAILQRFGLQTLRRIQASLPLEKETAARLAALLILPGEEDG